MVRVKLTRYWKPYLTKAKYHCRRYTVYIPVDLGDQLDLSVEYDVNFIRPYIILVPKDGDLPPLNLQNRSDQNAVSKESIHQDSSDE